MARHYVIARYQEDTTWAVGLSYDVIQKDCERVATINTPNIGREASSWLLWIINNYSKLPDQVTFLQGDPFDHTTIKDITEPVDAHYKRHGQLLECDQYGNPHHGGLKLSTPLSIMGISTPHPVKFCMGAQFTCSKEQILKYTYQQWVALFNYSIQESNAPWELERCWETMLS
jgi:hypothetical protein